MRRRGRTWPWFVAIVIGVFALAAGGVALTGWLLMLAVGALHHEAGWPPTPLSFWASVGIAAAVMVIGQVVRGEPIVTIKMKRRRW